jgi:hypothetical protein
MKNCYIKRIDKKTKKVQHFISFIPLGSLGYAEHWIQEPHYLTFQEAEYAFLRLTSDTDNIEKYTFNLVQS